MEALFSNVLALTQFQKEYVPLDSALVRAILSDYDLSQPTELRKARVDLDTLKESSSAYGTSDFDPSGTSGHTDASPDKSTTETLSTSEETECTRPSIELADKHVSSTSDDSGQSADDGALQGYENQSIESKEAQLRELFPLENAHDISYTLKKSYGSFGRALDILLNHSFLRNDEGDNHGGAIPLRGIDIFAEDYVVANKRKHKGRKFQSQQGYESDGIAADLNQNRWTTAKDDIGFVASRTGMPHQKIASIYHESGASRRSTILALVEQSISEHSNEKAEDLALEPGVLQLIDEFPTLPVSHAAAVVRIAQSTATTRDLARALTTSPAASNESTPARIVPQYVPYKEKSASTSQSTTPPTPSTPAYSGSVVSLSAARSAAFSQASAYYRKSKSDHLMGGAAAYYAQLGRDYHASLQTVSAAEADTLAASQCTATSLDLHGLGVKDAVRITNEKVGAWWDGLGELRAKMGDGRAVGEGYKVVTGIGRHSDGGVGKLGPAVAKALMQDGWKVEVAGGELHVKGRARK